MTSMIAQPQLMADAAANIEGIRSAIAAANAAAAGPTTGLAAAAADEVSAAAATLFGAYAQEYQAVIKQAAVFHDTFAQALATAATAYTEAEAANAAMVSGALRAVTSPIASLLGGGGAAAAPAGVAAPAPAALASPFDALIMTGSGTPIPSLAYMQAVVPYISGTPSQLIPLNTPEGLYPLTQIKDLPLTQSVTTGVQILHDALFGPQGMITAGGNVAVLGYSQSAILSSMEMRQLILQGSPNTANLSFTLLGNPMAPNGGLLSRFPGLSMPAMGLEFYGATPSNSGYQLSQYTLQYDGFADFPRYPINFLADLNAFMGIQFVHTDYSYLDPNNLPPGYNLVELPVSPANNGLEHYYMITYPGLPLLEPLRALPVIGDPLADLVEPNLTYLVNLGYGDPHFGYSTGYADVPTRFGLFPSIDPVTFAGDMVGAAQQGVNAFAGDIGAMLPTSLPDFSLPAAALTGGSPTAWALPTLPAPTGSPIDGIIDTLKAANTHITNAISSAAADTYAMALPTADIVNTLATKVPSYNVNLFLDGIQELANGDPAGLVNAFGYPVAADVALLTLAGGFQTIVLLNGVESVIGDLTGAA
ncbi:PE-PPE domain-containing protein [Mycobacterium kansasii]|nr:PE-PPE domain-containing protein [Mycobacterium kansasii]ARG59490.1 PE family protein [Mycobacterium kansasii]ARG64960.1 PE family protein [Mycobacterium kansasii]ARG72706.1 PE family protein [Mycobacterium kansasii]ARG78279.1 PE family protein [Mycobacterium kansasii]ARG83732.1 PE family protein [Mycobacterium kansasii]